MSQVRLDQSLFPDKKKKAERLNGIIPVTPSNGVKNSAKFNQEGITKLYVDVHEPEEIVEMLRKEKGIYVEVRAMTVSDYCFSNVGIERKTLHDFYNSIVHGDKHIWKQIFNLKHAFERPMLIIERWDDAFLSSPAMERTVRGAMASIFLMGISILVIPGKGQNAKPFVDQLAYLFFSSDKKALSMRPVPEKNKSTRKIEILEDLLSILPGWGRKSSKLMIDSYQSIPNLLAASTSDLLKKGLNRKQIYYLKLLMKDEDLSDLLNVRKEDKLS